MIDALQGEARSYMRNTQRLCHSFEPRGPACVLLIKRAVLGVTPVFAVGFVSILIFKSPGKRVVLAR